MAELSDNMMSNRAGAALAAAIAPLMASMFVSTSALAAALEGYAPAGSITGLATTAALAELYQIVNGITGDAPTVIVPQTLGDGSNEYAVLNTVFQSMPDGAVIRLLPGQKIKCDARLLDTTEKSFFLDGNGSHIEFTQPDGGITFQPPWAIKTFTTMSNDGKIVSGINDTSTLREKEPARITSSENIPDSKGTAKQCEDLFLETKIDAGSVQFMRASLSAKGLRQPYISNPRIAQRSKKRVVIHNLTVSQPDDVADLVTWQSRGIIELNGLAHPVLSNVNALRSLAPVYVQGCYKALIIGGRDAWRDDTKYTSDTGVKDKKSFGYGISDASFCTRIIGRSGYRLRHAVNTDDQTGYGNAPANPSLYGGSVGLTVIGYVAHGCTDDSFSTHHTAIGAKFIECGAIDGDSYAFGLRSQVELEKCWDLNCFGAWHAFDEIVNRTPSVTKVLIRDYVSRCSGPARNQCHVTPVEVYNYSWLDGTGYNPIGLAHSFDDCVTRLHGYTLLRPANILPAFNGVIGPNTAGLIEFDHIHIDVTAAQSQINTYLFDIKGGAVAGGVLNLRGGLITVEGSSVSTLFKYNAANLPNPGQIRFMLALQDGVATWNLGVQNIAGKVQVCGNDNLAALGDVTVINWNDRFRPIKGRTEEMTLNFGTAALAPGASATTTVQVFGFRATGVTTILADCNVAHLQFTEKYVSNDNTVTLTVKNVAPAGIADTSAVQTRLVLSR